MSEGIPESIPTSQDPRSKRPTKKRALTPVSEQAANLTALFAKPDQDIRLPDTKGAKKFAAAPPEIVANVQGSSAGAGSGEFHVYKASRRREYERLRAMDEEVRKEKDDEDFERERREREERDAEKTRKNREKRDKKRKSQSKSGHAKQGQIGNIVGTQGSGAIKPRPNGNASLAGDEMNGQARDETRDEAPEVGLIIHDDD